MPIGIRFFVPGREDFPRKKTAFAAHASSSAMIFVFEFKPRAALSRQFARKKERQRPKAAA